MKFISAIILISGMAISCNNNKTDGHENHSDSTGKNATAATAGDITTLKPTFTTVDEKVSTHIRGIFDHYAHVKTALVSSNASEAKKGADAMLQVIKSFDKSLLPADQKPAYDHSIGEIRNAAGGIAATDDLEAQRTHFSPLSNHAYNLAKSFGAGRTVYHDHCPMAFDNKGAMWLSENKEISNPYFGEKMMNCGKVEEVIEN